MTKLNCDVKEGGRSEEPPPGLWAGRGFLEGRSVELSQVPPPAHASRYELDQKLDKRELRARLEAKVFIAP